MSSVVVLDNGGGLIKVGFGGEILLQSYLIVSLDKILRRRNILSPINSFLLPSISLLCPFDRGYLINVDLQREIWDRVFRGVLHCDPTSFCLLLVEPLFNLPAIQRSTDEVVFEELGFQSITVLILYGYLIPISLYISIELVKVLQAKIINSDICMYNEVTGKSAKARTSNLNEELGQVDTILSDKTAK
ncbi:hypothetical protein ZOSMA_286G00160 [Zostera marina]|uniref:Actin-related protein n=1 Tax=Zostera marina TaxID=29655 RepID=A0A0K9PCT9_ZOSMR|nr:hypothetical protein ZOSMA_286G00160 [Zostera marina]